MNVTTDIEIFKESIVNSKKSLVLAENRSFSCAEFMRNIGSSDSDTVTLIYPRSLSYNSSDYDLLEWWISKLKDVGVEVEYFGINDRSSFANSNSPILSYIIKKEYTNPHHRLFMFTLLRYGWAGILINFLYFIKNLEDKNPKLFKENDFWQIFFILHPLLSGMYIYDSTFGFTVKGRNFSKIIKMDSKRMKSICSFEIGINNNFKFGIHSGLLSKTKNISNNDYNSFKKAADEYALIQSAFRNKVNGSYRKRREDLVSSAEELVLKVMNIINPKKD